MDNLKVKICGVRSPAIAEVAVDAGADMIGIILAPSRRKVSLEVGRAIFDSVPDTVMKVAIFQDSSVSDVIDGMESTGADLAQLSGNETVQFADSLKLPFMRTYRFLGSKLVPPIEDRCEDQIIHVDAPGDGGGHGSDWDYSLVSSLPGHVRVLLGGGLNIHNVADVVESVRPWGVDVSSGVENYGAKDEDMIRRFISVARLA
tara:strand:+ start:2758 stop:3366 length:609 start_codon:yes stop_codon:yes gene_type:complete